MWLDLSVYILVGCLGGLYVCSTTLGKLNVALSVYIQVAVVVAVVVVVVVVGGGGGGDVCAVSYTHLTLPTMAVV